MAMTKRQRKQLDRKGPRKRLRRPGYVKQANRPEGGSPRAKQRARRTAKGEDIDKVRAKLTADVLAARGDASGDMSPDVLLDAEDPDYDWVADWDRAQDLEDETMAGGA